MKHDSNMLGSWAFLIGVVLAVLLGIFGGALTATWLMVLVIIGLVVGFLNITEREVHPFLMSGIVLILAASLGGSLMQSIPYVGEILDALMAIFVPATIIVAIKNVFSLARK